MSATDKLIAALRAAGRDDEAAVVEERRPDNNRELRAGPVTGSSPDKGQQVEPGSSSPVPSVPVARPAPLGAHADYAPLTPERACRAILALGQECDEWDAADKYDTARKLAAWALGLPEPGPDDDEPSDCQHVVTPDAMLVLQFGGIAVCLACGTSLGPYRRDGE